LRYLILGILYTVVYLGAGAFLGGHPLVRTAVANTLLLALAGSVCVVVLRRRREWEGTHRLFWDTFAAGMAMWFIGEIGFTISSVTGQRTWVQWHTMFSLCGGIGPLVSLLSLPHLGARKASAWAVGVDLISYAMLMGFVYAYFIMVPSVMPAGGTSPQTTLLILVQVQRLLLTVGLAVSIWLARTTVWRDTFVRLAIGAGMGFFLRAATSGAISSGRYHEGSVYDLAWIVPFMCYLWAAVEAPATSGAAEPVPARGGWRAAVFSAAPVFLIPVIGFGLLGVQPIGDPGDSVRLLLTVLAMVAGLGVLTLRLSVQSGELQRADARLRLLAAATEQTADLILITRANGAFEHANDACIHALGYPRDELTSMTLPDLLERGFEGTVDQVGTEVRRKGIWRGTLVHRRKDGTTFPASSTVVALRNSDGQVTHFVGVERDITDELKLRDQLVHGERLSAIGELVAGVAHEINNPLQTIIGCVELMIEEQRAAGPLQDLELVRQEASRAGQIVRNLLAFVRRSSPNRAVADLNQIASATARLREHPLALRNIALKLELQHGALPVLVNREEIQQIVLNLVLNAEHAIGDAPGAIIVRTRAAGHTHVLQVIDDGPGISAELRGRVFEPFFTTKDVGEGTGLGLSIALGIATAHGGTLQLCQPGDRDRMSEAGSGEPDLPTNVRKGACFQLTLPAHAVTMAPADAQGAAVPPPAHAGRRQALVIEDEDPIRALLVRLLVRRDYDVTEAASCAQARTLIAGRTFDLVLCDVRLGDGNGGECLRQLRAAQPDIGRRFIFVTGDISALEDAAREFGELPVLTKPFTATDLDRLLGDVAVSV
jgi:PAS domain S-box-containing protein